MDATIYEKSSESMGFVMEWQYYKLGRFAIGFVEVGIPSLVGFRIMMGNVRTEGGGRLLPRGIPASEFTLDNSLCTFCAPIRQRDLTYLPELRCGILQHRVLFLLFFLFLFSYAGIFDLIILASLWGPGG